MKRPSIFSLCVVACSLLLVWSILERSLRSPIDERLFDMMMILLCYGTGLIFSWLFLMLGDVLSYRRAAEIVLKVSVIVPTILGVLTIALRTIAELAPELAVAAGIGTTLFFRLQMPKKAASANSSVISGSKDTARPEPPK